jgi:exopolysaccharide biosynthesis polyprenyl glycosylphosphotransferase
MFRRFSTNFALFSMALDSLLIILSLWLATRFRPVLSTLPFTADIRNPLHMPWQLYLLFPAVWVAVLILLSVYDGRRNFRVVDEVSRLTMGSVLAGVSLAGALYFSYRDVSRALFLAFILVSFILLLTWRLAARLAFRFNQSKPIQKRRVLIVGAGPVGRKLYSSIEKNFYLGLEIVGFLDDDFQKRAQSTDILGSTDQAFNVVCDKKVDDVVIALPGSAYERVNQLVTELHNLPVKVWVIPDYFHLALHKATITEFAGLPLLDLRAPALSDYQRMVKRAFDLFLGILVLPLTLVLMAIIAVAIRLESPGRIIFRQQRVGENGKIFEMYKFRTMVPGAEDLRHLVEREDADGNLIHKSAEDPRVTRVGKILRRTSLDELPNLFNVLKGELSIVGPRPEMPYLVERYEPWQRKRFAVPQGITGWWQVNGRSDRLMHLHTEDDLYYVQNYSLLLDILILIKTVGTVLRGKGAF